MISGHAISFLREWYREAYLLGVLLIIMGVAHSWGGQLEAATVFPTSIVTWVIALAGSLVFSLYFYKHVRWLADVVGHHREIGIEETVFRYIKITIFFLLMSFLSYYLTVSGLPWLALILWLLLILYPVAVAVDDVGELDNVLSSVEAWMRNPAVLLEFLFVGTVLLLTAYFLEVHLGGVGLVLSVLLTVLFTIPFLTTILSLAYLLRYPLTRRALEA